MDGVRTAPGRDIWLPGFTTPRIRRDSGLARMGNALGVAVRGYPIRTGGARFTPSDLYLSLVSMWEFENSGNLGLDSHGTNHLTNNNSVTQEASGKVGAAAQFVAASSQSLSRADTASLRATSTYFGSFFTYLDSTAGNPGFIYKAGEYRVILSSGFAFGHLSGSGSVNSGGTLGTGTWYFCAFWFDGSDGTLRCQLDGNAPMSAAGTAPSAGTIFTLGDAGGLFLSGRLDQVVWSKGYVPTAADISFLYNSGSGRSYTEIQTYSPFQITLWDLLDRAWWKRGHRPPEWVVKTWLPRIPAFLRGRRHGYQRCPSGVSSLA